MRGDQFRSLAREAEIRSFKHKWSSYRYARVCSTRIYKTIKSSTQTNTCAELAARYYYNKLHPPLDSHTFDQVGDSNAYYHVNFKARVRTRDSPLSLFFAELQGIDGPERVNLCVELSSTGDLENCDFCTGITHPPCNFIGCARP